MNWRRGLLRFWSIASLCWITAIGAWLGYEQWWLTHNQNACADVRRVEHLGNPFDCFDPGVAPVILGSVEYAIVIAGPIMVGLTLVFAVPWIVAGFRPNNSN